jgi:hypothetical protein
MAKKAFIPLDVVQIMMEYLLDFAAVIRCRARRVTSMAHDCRENSCVPERQELQVASLPNILCALRHRRRTCYEARRRGVS